MVETKISLPLTVEDQLERYAREANHSGYLRYQTLWHAWKQNKKWIIDLLQGIMQAFPTYSRHDETHAQNVIHNIELILGEDRIATLSASDCFILLHTVYLHDIGMVITAREREEIVQSDKFAQMVDYLEVEGDSSMRNAVEALKKTIYEYDKEDPASANRLYEEKLNVYYAIVALIGNYRRREHGEKSSERISESAMRDEMLGTGFSLAGIPQRIFLTIAECARLHTDAEFSRIMQLPQEDNGYVFDYMHPRFVSVLLQLGDILDMDNDRFHPLSKLYEEDMPVSSELHYKKHLAIRKLYISPRIIEIAAECEDQRALRQVRRECDMLTDILKQAGYLWNSICPRGFSGALPVVQSVDLKLNRQQIPKELVSAKFNISQKKAFQILEGANIYMDRFVFLREFLQNAIDATKLQYWMECKGTSHFYNDEAGDMKSPFALESYVSTKGFPIIIEMSICKQDRDSNVTLISRKDVENLDNRREMPYVYGVKVRIKDFGIGIGQETILKITEVGSGKDRRDKIIKEMPSWLRPTAEFGVGLQSAFLVTSSFSCRTHTRSGERYEITFGSGSLEQYDGYINVRPADSIQAKEDTYGTCFDIFLREECKMRHEECPASWNGEDIFDEHYETRRPLRHSAELISQMVLYIDSLLGETIFPVELKITSAPGITIPLNQNKKNQVDLPIKFYGGEGDE